MNSSGINHPFPLALFFLTFLLISPAAAVTLTNPRFNESMTAGTVETFDFSFVPDAEPSVTFQTISITGDCSAWVSLDRQAPMTFSNRTPVRARIAVPKDAANGMHRCDIGFRMPSTGMFTQVMSVPLSVNVTGGTTPTTVTTSTTVTTTAPTPAPTATTTTAPTVEPEVGMMALVILAAGIMVVLSFIAVMIYDYRREHR